MIFLTTLLISFLVVAAMIVAMSVGVMAGRKPIQGSCGGVGSGGCGLCSGPCRRKKADGGDSRERSSQ